MKYYVVDAFTNELFKGNPAGVCLLDSPLSNKIMQKIAFENNLAETAFLLNTPEGYSLRWFTPEVEIDLCGHATLATAHIVFNYLNSDFQEIVFNTKSGALIVIKQKDLLVMDFPSRFPKPCNKPDFLEQALGVNVLETHLSRDLVAVLKDEKTVKEVKPNIDLLSKINNAFAVIITAKGDNCDFVSRFFAPNAGISEDPVTGSSHSSLIPFWSKRLEKKQLIAKQLSKRGGKLFCENCGDRVKIGGKAICYSIGEIMI